MPERLNLPPEYGKEPVYAVLDIPRTHSQIVVKEVYRRKGAVDIRIFRNLPNYKGYTRQGVVVPKELLQPLIDILIEIRDEQVMEEAQIES